MKKPLVNVFVEQNPVGGLLQSDVAEDTTQESTRTQRRSLPGWLLSCVQGWCGWFGSFVGANEVRSGREIQESLVPSALLQSKCRRRYAENARELMAELADITKSTRKSDGSDRLGEVTTA